MSKTVILVEKPSVARDFAAALGAAFNKQRSCYEGKEHIIVHARGHLLEALMPDQMDAKYKAWNLDVLPIAPEALRYKPAAETKKLLLAIKSVFDKEPCAGFTLATDAGREGELIGRLILDYCGIKERPDFKRFWVSEALTPETVCQGLANLQPLSAFDKLYAQGSARQYADWIVGINCSRLMSAKTRSKCSVGRVQSPTLHAIVERQKAIEGFKGQDYFQIAVTAQNEAKTHTLQGLVYAGEPAGAAFAQREAAQAALAFFDTASSLEIVEAQEEEKRERPPLLFSLTALQKAANKQLGFSAAKTLKIAQKLYEERKCLSYPRTPSCVLGEGNVELARQTAAKLAKAYPQTFAQRQEGLFALSNKRVFDNAKLEDHHALMPLAALPEEAEQDEKELYRLVLLNFAAAFHADCRYKSRRLACACGEGAKAVFKGREIIEQGFKALYQEKKETNGDEEARQSVPVLKAGDFLLIGSAKIQAKKTKAPEAFDEAGLLAFMENPKALSEEEAAVKLCGLGTPATRAEIIEGLLRGGLIERAGKKLRPTERGRFADAQIGKTSFKELLSPKATADWEARLESDPLAFREEIKNKIKENIMSEKENQTIEQAKTERQSLGVCPKCGKGRIYEGNKKYYCSEWKEGPCDFGVWKEIAGQTLTQTDVKKLLAGEPTAKRTFNKRAGGTFEAQVKLNSEHKTEFAFND